MARNEKTSAREGLTYAQLATLLGPTVCKFMNETAGKPGMPGEDQVANVVQGINELLAVKRDLEP